MPSSSPPHAPPEHAASHLRERGHVVLSPRGLARLVDAAEGALDRLAPHWDGLPEDTHLRDGGRYRRRRHGSFVLDEGELRLVPHCPHWQPVDDNPLHGGIERWFEPLPGDLVASEDWRTLLIGLTGQAAALRGHGGPWFIEAHLFRIDTSGGIGRPTPEGAHRDGFQDPGAAAPGGVR